MARIILIETATDLCSTALSEDGKVVCSRESDVPRAHASMTAVFVDQMLRERGLRVSDCDAVCVSMGPGSYTGLRVGSSTAKGLCFGAGIPLLAVTTAEVLVAGALAEGLVPEGCSAIVPMIDARRMEVYSAVFSPDGKQRTDIAPTVVTSETFSGLVRGGKVLFIGDGAGKCRGIICEAAGESAPEPVFIGTEPRAAWMAGPAERAFAAGEWRDTAYFEPLYIKDFVATVSRKKLF